MIYAYFSAVSQTYQAEIGNKHVIVGNDVLVKCDIPSHVAEFVEIVGWVDSEGNEFHKTQSNYGKLLFFKLRIRTQSKDVHV